LAHTVLNSDIAEVKILGIEDRWLELLCSALLCCSPNIQYLDVAMYSRSSTGVARLICGSHHLRSLHLHDTGSGDRSLTILPVEAIAHLGRLRNLTTLKAIEISPQSHQFLTTANKRFPNLKDFHFYSSEDWLSCAKIISSMRCCFVDLSIWPLIPDQFHPTSTLREFAQSMLGHPCLSSLTHLTLGDRWVMQDDLDETSDSNIFLPLFACVALKQLKLIFPNLNIFDDAWLANAATAWPSLELLDIKGIHANPKMTLAGLVPLIKMCPQLQSLELPLKAELVAITLLDGAFNPNLIRACFETPSIESPRQVFRFLSRVLPNVEQIWSPSPHGREVWREVNKLMHDAKNGNLDWEEWSEWWEAKRHRRR
jgi:hypothetical protein